MNYVCTECDYTLKGELTTNFSSSVYVAKAISHLDTILVLSNDSLYPK